MIHNQSWTKKMDSHQSCDVEILPFRQYCVKMNGSGRVSFQKCRFLKLNHTGKEFSAHIIPNTISSPITADITPTSVPSQKMLICGIPTVIEAAAPTRLPQTKNHQAQSRSNKNNVSTVLWRIAQL